MGNTDNAVVNTYWKAVDYLYLKTADIFTSSNKLILERVDPKVAAHLVKVHNNWWDSIVWESYYDNIMEGIAIDVANYYGGELAPLPEGVLPYEPLTEDEWFDYDEPYETT